MHKTLLLVSLFGAACSYPRYVATKVVELQLPVEAAARLHCETHNGDIKIRRGATSETIAVRAEMSVRGFTQEEADANLHLLSVGQARDGDRLKLFGAYPRSELRNRSPSFAFTLQVPEAMALELVTHNGDVETRGTSGALSVETHNGDIEGAVASPKVRVRTHNGDVDLEIESDGALDGSLTTHNGNVRLSLAGGAHGWLEAVTHNGSISPPDGMHEATVRRRSVRGRIGEAATDGRLRVETHNGSVVVR